MLDKIKTQQLVDKIFKNNNFMKPTELEWINEEYAVEEPEELWCRFFTSDLGHEEIKELVKHFCVYISYVDFKHIDKDSSLIHYYNEFLKEEDVTLFQVQLEEL